MFAGSQLPSNQPSAAALLPALLPLGEGRTLCKSVSVAEVMHILGAVNIHSEVWCRRGCTGTPVLSESQNYVGFFPPWDF